MKFSFGFSLALLSCAVVVEIVMGQRQNRDNTTTIIYEQPTTTNVRPKLQVSFKASERFLKGADISMLTTFEQLGALYQDGNHQGDLIKIMMNHGFNSFRLRLFVDPNKTDTAVVQDLPYVLQLAKRIKSLNAKLLLDIHYSDTWADPSHQAKPKDWMKLTFAELKIKIEAYTAAVVRAMKDNGCLPDIIQIGNEINDGFLWPDGRIGDEKKGGWDNFATLLSAAIRGAKSALTSDDKMPKIMIHISESGSAATTDWFFRNLIAHGVEFDLIGLSYYPWWHGGIRNLNDNLQQTAAAFEKGLVVVETAYPWRNGSDADKSGPAINWARTPEGQQQFLQDVVDAVYRLPNDRGRGVFWWYPESILIKGLFVWKGGRVALFDEYGRPLPAQDVKIE